MPSTGGVGGDRGALGSGIIGAGLRPTGERVGCLIWRFWNLGIGTGWTAGATSEEHLRSAIHNTQGSDAAHLTSGLPWVEGRDRAAVVRVGFLMQGPGVLYWSAKPGAWEKGVVAWQACDWRQDRDGHGFSGQSPCSLRRSSPP